MISEQDVNWGAMVYPVKDNSYDTRTIMRPGHTFQLRGFFDISYSNGNFVIHHNGHSSFKYHQLLYHSIEDNRLYVYGIYYVDGKIRNGDLVPEAIKGVYNKDCLWRKIEIDMKITEPPLSGTGITVTDNEWEDPYRLYQEALRDNNLHEEDYDDPYEDHPENFPDVM
jgi:hypothetical protein